MLLGEMNNQSWLISVAAAIGDGSESALDAVDASSAWEQQSTTGQ